MRHPYDSNSDVVLSNGLHARIFLGKMRLLLDVYSERQYSIAM